jgi:adenosylcobinamide-GDP ribazoletransferase
VPEFITDLARSVAFLSRLPVPARFFEGHDGSVARACRAFPTAGALIALPSALLIWLMEGSPEASLLAAFLALALAALLTGGLHEDGLADSADGLFGGRDKEHALTIMKDSRIGSFGVIGLIASFGIRAAALSALISTHGGTLAASALISAAAISRALMVWHWAHLPPARVNGTAVAMGQPQSSAVRVAVFSALGFALLLIVAGASLGSVIAMLMCAAGAAFLFIRYVREKIGGHTGDTIGATQQITEMACLAALVISL